MKLLNRFLLIDMLFQGGRMFVGGVSVAFLLSRGLLVSDIAVIKTLQAVVVFLAEIPTGIVSDKLGRRFGLVIAVVSCLIGFMLYLFGNGIIIFLFGEFFLALSLCWWSGSYEAWVCSETGIEESPEQTKHFYHLNTFFSQAAVVFLGWGGGILSGMNRYENSYIAAILVMVILLFIILVTKETRHNRCEDEKSVFDTNIIRSTFSVILNNNEIAKVTMLMALLQFLIQPMLHYWQPMFMSYKVNLGPQQLGQIFAAYSAVTAVASWVFRKINFKYEKIILVVWLGIYLMLGQTTDFTVALTLFLLLQVGYVFLRTRIGARLAHSASSRHRASIISISTFIARFGMLISLWLIHHLLAGSVSESANTYPPLFSNLGIVAVVLSVSFLFLRPILKKKLIKVQLVSGDLTT